MYLVSRMCRAIRDDERVERKQCQCQSFWSIVLSVILEHCFESGVLTINNEGYQAHTLVR